jgi:hypothetical protein
MKEAQVTTKHRFLQEPHGVTSQKTPFFIVTDMKTSNLTYQSYLSEKAQVGMIPVLVIMKIRMNM